MSQTSEPIFEETIGSNYEPDDDTPPSGSRRMDPELRTMAAMLRLLEELPEPARQRVIAWVADRIHDDVRRKPTGVTTT